MMKSKLELNSLELQRLITWGQDHYMKKDQSLVESKHDHQLIGKLEVMLEIKQEEVMVRNRRSEAK